MRLATLFLVALLCSWAQAQIKNLSVDHWRQDQYTEWVGGRLFTSPVDQQEKSLCWAACWPNVVVETAVYFGVIANEGQAIDFQIGDAYRAFADFPDGAHTVLIPDYVRRRWPTLAARLVDVSGLDQTTLDRKWQLVRDSVDHNWPVLSSVSWVKNRGRIFRHAILIRGYDATQNTVFINDPSGGAFLTGGEPTSNGSNLRLPYDDFYDDRFIIVAKYGDLVNLDFFIGQFQNGR